MKARELKPCPFCGCEPELRKKSDKLVAIVCPASSSCADSGLAMAFAPANRDKAVAQWNRRAAQATVKESLTTERPESEHRALVRAATDEAIEDHRELLLTLAEQERNDCAEQPEDGPVAHMMISDDHCQLRFYLVKTEAEVEAKRFNGVLHPLYPASVKAERDALRVDLDRSKARTDRAINEIRALRERVKELEAERLPADWETDSSLETWFPYTAERIAELESQVRTAGAEAVQHLADRYRVSAEQADVGRAQGIEFAKWLAKEARRLRGEGE